MNSVAAHLTLLHKYCWIMDLLTFHQENEVLVHIRDKSIQYTLHDMLTVRSLLGGLTLQIVTGTFHSNDLVSGNRCDLGKENKIR